MKKFFIYLSAALLTLGLFSCEGPQGPQGPQGPAGKDGADGTTTDHAIVDVQIDQSEWSYSNIDNNNYFYATVSMPEITWDVYNYGLVKVYREYNTGADNASQVELPYTNLVEYSYTVDGDANTYWGFYTEHVYYEYTAEQFTFYYLASDFDYELNTTFTPEAMHFRVVVVSWPD